MKTKTPKPFIDDAAFADAAALAALLAAPLPALPPVILLSAAQGTQPHAETPLTRAEARERFLQYNAARRQSHATGDARWATRARHYEDFLIRRNTGLIGLAMGVWTRKNGPGRDVEEMYSACLYGLMRAVRYFDSALGIAFSTFAMRILFNDLTAVSQKAHEHAQHCVNVDCQSEAPPGPDAGTADECDNLRRVLAENSARLNDDELFAIEFRFLDDDAPTLEAVGQCLGVSKERVRQIVVRALKKLRYYLKTGKPLRGNMPNPAA